MGIWGQNMGQSDGAPKARRSQRERSQSMQKKILDATLTCLGERGYHNLAIQEIANAAGVSRGAITHHYISKLELTSEAIRHFVSWRHDRIASAFLEKKPQTLADRLNLLWESFQTVFPITFEILLALRSEPELLARFKRHSSKAFEGIADDYENFFPEFSGLQLPSATISMIISFYRGLYFETVTRPADQVDRIKADFEALLMEALERRNHLPAELKGFTTSPLSKTENAKSQSRDCSKN